MDLKWLGAYCERWPPVLLSCPINQMPIKRIVVLANSIKKSLRCVAGREVFLSDAERVSHFGGWIRPIRLSDEGALHQKDYQLSTGAYAKVLDIVDITVGGLAGSPGQPENWLHDESAQWSFVGTLSKKAIGHLTEKVPDLWNNGGRSDRIGAAEQVARQTQSSLAIIAPSGLRIVLSRDKNYFSGHIQKQAVACFTYAGAHYKLNITDPNAGNLHGPFPEPEGPSIDAPPTCGDNCRLVVSLTPPFKGYHYKVVATIITL